MGDTNYGGWEASPAPAFIFMAPRVRWLACEFNLAGNAIHFHVQVLGLSFHDAMRLITGT